MLAYHAKLTPADLFTALNGYRDQLTQLGSLLCQRQVSLRLPKTYLFGGLSKMKRPRELDVGWTHMQARAALQVVFGDQILHPSRTRHWFQAFHGGQTTLVDLQRAHWRKTGRSPANVQVVKALIETDRSLSIAALMTQSGRKQTTVYRI